MKKDTVEVLIEPPVFLKVFAVFGIVMTIFSIVILILTKEYFFLLIPFCVFIPLILVAFFGRKIIRIAFSQKKCSFVFRVFKWELNSKTFEYYENSFFKIEYEIIEHSDGNTTRYYLILDTNGPKHRIIIHSAFDELYLDFKPFREAGIKILVNEDIEFPPKKWYKPYVASINKKK